MSNQEETEKRLSEIREQVKTNQLNIYDVKQQIPFLLDLVDELKGRIVDLTNNDKGMSTTMNKYVEENTTLKQKVSELEEQLRIVGSSLIKEVKPMDFIERTIHELQSKLALAQSVVEKAKGLEEYAALAESRLEPTEQLECLTLRTQFDEALEEMEKMK